MDVVEGEGHERSGSESLSDVKSEEWMRDLDR